MTSCGSENIGRSDLVHDFGGRVAEHAFGADVENLDDALGIGGDAGEVGAVEDGALQGSRLEFGADQQVTDDLVLGVAQRRDRHHSRKAGCHPCDVGQFVDVLDAARSLEYQGLEARRDRCTEFDAQRLGARDQFLRDRKCRPG